MLFSLDLEGLRRLRSHAWCLDRSVWNIGLSGIPFLVPGPFYLVFLAEYLDLLPGSSALQETRVEAAILPKLGLELPYHCSHHACDSGSQKPVQNLKERGRLYSHWEKAQRNDSHHNTLPLLNKHSPRTWMRTEAHAENPSSRSPLME